MQWLRLDDDDMLHACGEAESHLMRMQKRAPLNLISIFGAARQGKSFLMNMLAGPEGCGFRVSNKQDPCTVGVDLASNTVTLDEFRGGGASRGGLLGGLGRKAAAAMSGGASKAIRVGFVDAEGQGDRDTSYDARIACPVLLSSQCVLFNWKDSVQKDRILNLLGVMCRAAKSVGSAEASSSASSLPPFGHLHIVFRDWAFDGTAESVRDQLLGEEDDSRNEDAQRRNDVRRVIHGAFESITVWLLPPPAERTADLGKVLRPDMLSSGFKDGVRELKTVLVQQLASPRLWGGRPVTGPCLAKLVPVVAEALNRDELVLPKSAYESMVRAEAEMVRAAVQDEVAGLCVAFIKAGVDADPAELEAACQEAVRRGEARLEEVTSDADLVAEHVTSVRTFAMTELQRALQERQRALFPGKRLAAREALQLVAEQLAAQLEEETSKGKGLVAVAGLRSALDESLTSITQDLQNAALAAGLSKAEMEEAVSSLVALAASHLEALTLKRAEVERASMERQRQAEDELYAQAKKALLERMQAEAKASLHGRLDDARAEVLIGAVVEQLGSRLRQDHGATEARVLSLTRAVETDGKEEASRLTAAAAGTIGEALTAMTQDHLTALKAKVTASIYPKSTAAGALFLSITQELNALVDQVTSEVESQASEWGASVASLLAAKRLVTEYRSKELAQLRQTMEAADSEREATELEIQRQRRVAEDLAQRSAEAEEARRAAAEIAEREAAETELAEAAAAEAAARAADEEEARRVDESKKRRRSRAAKDAKAEQEAKASARAEAKAKARQLAEAEAKRRAEEKAKRQAAALADMEVDDEPEGNEEGDEAAEDDEVSTKPLGNAATNAQAKGRGKKKAAPVKKTKGGKGSKAKGPSLAEVKAQLRKEQEQRAEDTLIEHKKNHPAADPDTGRAGSKRKRASSASSTAKKTSRR